MTTAGQSPSARQESTGRELTDPPGDRACEVPTDRSMGVPDGAPLGDGGRGPGAGAAGPGGLNAFDLAARIRQLAGCDPADVQRVIGDVLAELERVTGGRVRERLAEPGAEGGRTSDPG